MPLRVPIANDDLQSWKFARPLVTPSATATTWITTSMSMEPSSRRRRAGSQPVADERKGIPSKYWQPAKLPTTMKGFEIGSDSDFTTLTMVQRPATATQSGETSSEVVARLMAAHSQTSMLSAKMRGDELPELPGWLIGLLAGLLSFGLIVAVVLCLANFPPEWNWLRRIRTPPQRRKKGGYAKVNSDDEGSADEKRGRRKLALRSPEAVGLGISYTSSTAGGGGGIASRRRKNLSVDTSGRYGGLGTAVSGSRNVAARRDEGERREWRSSSYDEEKLRHREPPPLSPARFAWEALTAPIPSLAGFSAMLDGGGRGVMSGAHTRSMTGGLGNERELEVEGGRNSPRFQSKAETDVFRTPAEVAVPGVRSVNVFGQIGESVERAAATMGRVLSDAVDGSAEQGLLLPVRDSERERGYEPALRAVV
ncbi:hypothetical protein LTR74_011493 [Friedmanniomyces endolithicus]|nr:hypothetical protein LTR74_011493 [Friedmanniomyces endolithicus]